MQIISVLEIFINLAAFCDYLIMGLQGYFFGRMKLAEIQLKASMQMIQIDEIIHKVKM